MKIDGPIDLGCGYVAEPIGRLESDETIGLIITGPRAPACKYVPDSADPPRCGGFIAFAGHESSGRPGWKVEQEHPLTLSPSIKCGCGGQHGLIQDGRYVNADGVVDG